MTEHTEAVMLMRAIAGAERDWPELALFFAVPNGGHRAKRVAGQMKAEGVRQGVPDYLFPVPRGGNIGLAIELKTEKGRASTEQRWWLAALAEQGWHTALCRGWEEAWCVVRDYLNADGPDSPQELT